MRGSYAIERPGARRVDPALPCLDVHGALRTGFVWKDQKEPLAVVVVTGGPADESGGLEYVLVESGR